MGDRRDMTPGDAARRAKREVHGVVPRRVLTLGATVGRPSSPVDCEAA